MLGIAGMSVVSAALTRPTLRGAYKTVYFWVKEVALAELSRLMGVPMSSGLTSVYILRDNYIFKELRGDPRWEALLNDPKNNAPLF